ncbi:GGDEF domain-containing protein [Desulfocurvus sp. DL9XJH121]
MARFTLFGEFPDRESEDAFQIAHWPETSRKMCYACAISALVYLGAVSIDYTVLGVGPRLGVMAGGRFLVSLFGAAAMLFTRPGPRDARALGWALCAYMLSILLCETLELVVKVDTLDLSGAPACAVILLTFYFMAPPKALPTLAACWLGSLCFVLTTAFLTSVPVDQVWYVGLTLCLVNAFGYISLTRYERARRSEFQAVSHLKMLAEIDTLTQVYNRRKVLQLGERMFMEARRFNDPLAVLLLDVDHFKAINDRYGHGGGDAALQAVTGRCVEQLREVDVFGRVGGEEFMALLPHTGIRQAADIAERLRESVRAAPVAIGDAAVTMRVSIGVAQLSPETPTLDSLIHDADLALYEAKKSGRDRVCARAAS